VDHKDVKRKRVFLFKNLKAYNEASCQKDKWFLKPFFWTYWLLWGPFSDIIKNLVYLEHNWEVMTDSVKRGEKKLILEVITSGFVIL